MFEVLHQLIDRVRWAHEEEQRLAHQAIADYQAASATGAHASPAESSKPARLSVADTKSNAE